MLGMEHAMDRMMLHSSPDVEMAALDSMKWEEEMRKHVHLQISPISSSTIKALCTVMNPGSSKKHPLAETGGVRISCTRCFRMNVLCHIHINSL